MKRRCLTSGRMTMRATLLHQNDDFPGYPDLEQYGDWVNSQDPLTGEIVRVWKPYPVPDNPETPENDPSILEIPCIARGIVDGGIRVAGTTERFGESYENIDYIKMWVPAHVKITKRDRITNVKDRTGRIRWRDEEFEDFDAASPATFNANLRATVFNVNGVTPLFDAFNNLTEWFVLLERAEVSSE